MRANVFIAALIAAQFVFLSTSSAQDERPIPEDKDVQTTESGLKYSILKPGTGDLQPRMGDKVSVHYTGWLTDGTIFDSSHRRGVPATFTLGQVIDGWNEGLQLMTTGATFKFTIPPKLGYGAMGRAPTIPANATLIFEIELLDVTAGPRFVKPDPEQLKATDSGLKYQVLAEGEGSAAGPDDMVGMHYSIWDGDGKLLVTDFMGDRPPIAGKCKDLTLPLLTEAALLLKPGGKCVFVAPLAMAYGSRPPPDLAPDAVSIWILEMIKPLPEPEFRPPDVETGGKTPSGLEYEVVEPGEGTAPKMGQMVKVHYAGWLADGNAFDSSFPRGEPTGLRLGQVIPGWNEGLQMMKPGAIYRFKIPAAIAYGARGKPPVIPPNADLVFYIQLVSIE